jgi:hypothetical protein
MNERANEDGQLEDVDDYDHQCEVVLKTLYWLAVLKVKDPEFDTSISLMSVRICSVKNSCSNMSPQSRSQSQSQSQRQSQSQKTPGVNSPNYKKIRLHGQSKSAQPATH